MSLRQGSVETPRLWQQMATQLLAKVQETWTRKRMGILLDLAGQRAHHISSFMWADNFWITSHSKSILGQMQRDLIEEAEKWDLAPKLASPWWTSTCETWREVWSSNWHQVGTSQISLWRKIQDLGMCYESARNSAWRYWRKNAIRKQCLVERCENLQKWKCAVVNQVSKNGGTNLKRLLLWDCKVVLDPENSWQNQRMGDKDDESSIPLQKRKRRNMSWLLRKNLQSGQENMGTDGFTLSDHFRGWWHDAYLSTIRTTISPTTRKPRTRTLDNSVFPQCLKPLFCTFLMMILLFG